MRALPAATYALVERTPNTLLFEGNPISGDGGEKPWTRLFTAPLKVCVASSATEIPALFAEIERAVADGFIAAGYFSYECGMAFEPKANMRAPCTGTPLAWFGIYERAYLYDHATGKFTDGRPPALDDYGDQVARSASDIGARFALSEMEYAGRIAAIQDLIRAGDIYQLNFTAPMRFSGDVSASELYRRLRERQATRYGAFLHTAPDEYTLSFSPELFFRIDHTANSREVVTRPMKGTARRGCTTAEDRAMAEWLRNDTKNRAENLMIVDLLRSDLGRIARIGSVRTENLFAVERLATLWQMTSTVSAELRDDVRYVDVFRALFPCGSVTGAPKIRAMQLIGKLEGEPRGIYTGAIGFFSPRETVFNVAIRTVELKGNQGKMSVGSGIVIDSDPAAEYRECLLKAEFLTRLRNQDPPNFSLIETMRWDGDYSLLELHLDRLCDSADYFGIHCNRALVRSVLEHHAHKFGGEGPRRVRLLLSYEGKFSIADELLRQPEQDKTLPRVRIAAERTDQADPMLFHKTTHRAVYNQAFDAAARDGYADVLFFNTCGELTEGAISNVVIEKNGRWFTPPIECGLLAGVYRRHLLETRPNIEERKLYKEDLRSANAIYICNALRGLRKVSVEWSDTITS